MKNLKTYITYFDDSQIEDYNLKEDESTTLFKANDTSYSGKSINNMNIFYCELCTMYYIWKNDIKSDYIVLKQYRRPFEWEKVGRLPENGEIICYKPFDLNGIPVIYQYAIYHGKKRAFSLLSIIKDLYGEKSDEYNYLTRGRELYTNNTFVIKWDDFCNMCEFVFNTTDYIDKVYGLKHNYNKYILNAREYTEDGRYEYQKHWMAYIGERLVSCYIATKMKPLTIDRLDGDGFYKPYKEEEIE